MRFYGSFPWVRSVQRPDPSVEFVRQYALDVSARCEERRHEMHAELLRDYPDHEDRCVCFHRVG